MEQMCTRCVMDTTASDIVFDERGVCNFCKDYEKKEAEAKNQYHNLEAFIEQVRRDGKDKKYDCIVGVSGGVDSSYVLLQVKKLGLRPLAVHLDNGWNSEFATKNITNLVEKLGIDLYTYTIDWEENKDLQRSFFKANVIDIELIMDNAMQALNYHQAKKYGIRYILSGCNTTTEGLVMPKGWNHYKNDAKNIWSIQRKFGTMKIKSLKTISTVQQCRYIFINGIRWIPFLDYLDYNKDNAIDLLEKEIGYIKYPYKHYESIFTRFYQGYILPQKFNVDKRKVHLSNLIMSGQIERNAAVKLLQESPYPDNDMLLYDRKLVTERLGFTPEEFNAYIQAPEVPHSAYGSEVPLYDLLLKIYRKFFKRILKK